MFTLNHNFNQPQQPSFLTQYPALKRHISIKGTLKHESTFIRKRAAQNILNAFHFAEWLVKSFNVYVVINLNDTIAQSSTTAFTKILAKYRVWLEYKRTKQIIHCPPLYVFSHENPAADNPHVNWCIYIPPSIIDEFNLKLPRWIAAVQGELESNTVKSQLITEDEYWDRAYYIIKGLDPDFIDHFGMRYLCDQKGPQGVIYGQRAGFSRAMGPVAMKRKNFSPKLYYRMKRRDYLRSS